MSRSVPNSYLTTEVTTATPQKLQLMLIEAAIRSAEQARILWREGDEAGAAESLGRARQITGRILAGLNREAAPDLVPKVAAVYLFLFRALGEANLHRDEQKLDEALRVLRVEQETWRQVCAKLGTSTPHFLPGAPADEGALDAGSSAFSLEA